MGVVIVDNIKRRGHIITLSDVYDAGTAIVGYYAGKIMHMTCLY